MTVPERAASSRLTRTGKALSIGAPVVALLVFLIGQWDLRGEDGGLEDLGTAIAYGMVVVLALAVAFVGLILFGIGLLRDRRRGPP